MNGRSVPDARRVITIERASSSSGEKGTVRMSSTPRSNAASFIFRSPRRVRPRTGVMPRVRPFAAPIWPSRAVLSSWSMSITARWGDHSARIAFASARVRAARTAKTTVVEREVMRSTTSGRSWSTSARRASSVGFALPAVTRVPRCAAERPHYPTAPTAGREPGVTTASPPRCRQTASSSASTNWLL